MSPQNLAAQELASGQLEVKQRTSVYTVMLFISFAAIVLASILLYQELKMWGDYPWWKTTEAIPQGTSFVMPEASDSVISGCER